MSLTILYSMKVQMNKNIQQNCNHFYLILLRLSPLPACGSLPVRPLHSWIIHILPHHANNASTLSDNVSRKVIYIATQYLNDKYITFMPLLVG